MAGAALWTMFLYILYRTSRHWLGYDRVSLMSWQLACPVMHGSSVWPQVMPSMAAPDFGLSSEGHSHATETGKQLASAS